MNIFTALRQGDSASWHDDPVYDSANKRYDSGAYQLQYILAGPIEAPLVLTAAADGPGWRTSITPTQSVALNVGTYWWQAVLTATGERVTAGDGELIVTPGLASASGMFDGRSLAEKALADAEAALAKFQQSGGKVKRYTIGSRSMEFQTLADIMQVVSYWRVRVVSEGASDKIAQGLGNPRKLFVRFR